MLILKDIEFPIEEVTFGGAVGRQADAVIYTLRVYAESRKITSLEHELTPIFHWDGLRFPIDRWRQLNGKSAQWEEADLEYHLSQCTSFIFGHEVVKQAKLKLEWRGGTNFSIAWSGLCYMLWDEHYGWNHEWGIVPFHIETIAKLNHVMVCGDEHDTDATMR